MKLRFICFAAVGLFIGLSFLLSCQNSETIDTSNISVKVDIQRFDETMMQLKTKEQIKGFLLKNTKFVNQFYQTSPEDTALINRLFLVHNNSDTQAFYEDTKKSFGNLTDLRNQLETAFKHIKYYFPETTTPKVYTVIAEMDYNKKAIYANDKLIIALELYLGANHKFYEFPKYLKQNFEERQMMPDIVTSFSLHKIPPPSDKTLLANMIYYGKELYLKDLLLPEYTDAEKIGYQPQQITWCQENESYMWRFFIDENLLFDSDSRLPNRFINLAPFSKFYLEIDNESPGRVGQWVGWQIVRSFMENNEVSVQDMLKMDAKQLFDKSKYKPKKNE